MPCVAHFCGAQVARSTSLLLLVSNSSPAEEEYEAALPLLGTDRVLRHLR